MMSYSMDRDRYREGNRIFILLGIFECKQHQQQQQNINMSRYCFIVRSCLPSSHGTFVVAAVILRDIVWTL